MKSVIHVFCAATILGRVVSSPALAGPVQEANKKLVSNAMHELFVTRDAAKAVRLYFGKPYLQHNPMIPDGAQDLPKVVTSLPANFKYEPGVIVADGDLVMIHGLYTGWARSPWSPSIFPREKRQAGRALGSDAGKCSRIADEERSANVPDRALTRVQTTYTGAVVTARQPTFFIPHGGGPCFYYQRLRLAADPRRSVSWARSLIPPIGSHERASGAGIGVDALNSRIWVSRFSS